MCGIAGTFGWGDRAVLQRMSAAQAHRGPDGGGVYESTRVGLAHRRLSIIDLSDAGRNPMFNEEGDLVLVHNGEIYNYRDLRPELEAKGHRFSSRTDTEVILHGHEEWGLDALSRFNGMFAYALWNETRQELVLARDRLGIKPLFYVRLPRGRLAFASEIKALLTLPDVKREIDPIALHEYLNLRYVSRDRTMFEGIRSLPAGHVLVAGRQGVHIGRYWRPVARAKPWTESAVLDRLRAALQSSVERHMISDVPVGIYLSGGIDSSAFVALASKTTDAPLRTFCMGFGEPNDELADARVVAEAFRTDHTEIIVKAELLRDLPRMIWHMDAPRRNLYPYYLAEAASKRVKVVLNGLGGDELFGGYEFRYAFMEAHASRRARVRPAARKAIGRAGRALVQAKADGEPVEGYPALREARKDATIDDPARAYLLINAVDEVYDDAMLRRIYGPRLRGRTQGEIQEMFEPRFRRGSPTDKVLASDLELRLVYDFLPVDDAVGMAFSIENRVPFLDNELVDLALGIPSSMKYAGGAGKVVLKKALAPILPRSTLAKKKQGFSPNVLASYQDEVRDVAKAILPGGALVEQGYCDPSFIDRVLKTDADPKLMPHHLLIWKMMAFEVWHKIYFDGEDVSRPNLDPSRFY